MASLTRALSRPLALLKAISNLASDFVSTGPIDELAFLRSAIGDSALLAAYSFAYAGSAPSNTSITDMRGSTGFGPTLTGTCTYDGVTKHVGTFNGTANELVSAGSAKFDTTAGITLVALAKPLAATAGLAGIRGTGGAVLYEFVGISGNGTTTVSGESYEPITFGSQYVSSTVSAAGARKLILAARTGNTLSVEVPATAKQSGTVQVNSPTASSILGIGRNLPTNWGNWEVRALLVLAGVYTTAQRDSLVTWASTYHSGDAIVGG